MYNKIYYISELNLTSKSAYSIHVLKMSEAIKKLGYDIKLFTIYNQSLSKTYNFYNIKNKFKIISIFKSKIRINFFLRLFYSFKILRKTNSEKCVYISRSIIFALISCLFKKRTILELHHEITGFSKILYFFFKTFKIIENLNYIFLHKKLSNIYKIKKKRFTILDDAVCLKDFILKKNKKYKRTCVYVGSFFEGKGIEQIIRLAAKNKKINFHIYGEKKYLNYEIISKNIRVFNHIPYKKIPEILSKYHVALMPYQNRVKGRSSIWIEKYMSPLKMFDYLASGLLIIATDLRVYNHIMKHNYNCKLVTLNHDDTWNHTIKNLFDKLNKYNYLKKNALLTATKYTWEIRAKLIFKKFIL